MTERRTYITPADLLKQERRKLNREQDLAFWRGKDVTEYYADFGTLASERPDLVICTEHASDCCCADEENKDE